MGSACQFLRRHRAGRVLVFAQFSEAVSTQAGVHRRRQFRRGFDFQGVRATCRLFAGQQPISYCCGARRLHLLWQVPLRFGQPPTGRSPYLAHSVGPGPQGPATDRKHRIDRCIRRTSAWVCPGKHGADVADKERVRDREVVQVAVPGVPVGLDCLSPHNRDYLC